MAPTKPKKTITPSERLGKPDDQIDTSELTFRELLEMTMEAACKKQFGPADICDIVEALMPVAIAEQRRTRPHQVIRLRAGNGQRGEEVFCQEPRCDRHPRWGTVNGKPCEKVEEYAAAIGVGKEPFFSNVRYLREGDAQKAMRVAFMGHTTISEVDVEVRPRHENSAPGMHRKWSDLEGLIRGTLEMVGRDDDPPSRADNVWAALYGMERSKWHRLNFIGIVDRIARGPISPRKDDLLAFSLANEAERLYGVDEDALHALVSAWRDRSRGVKKGRVGKWEMIRRTLVKAGIVSPTAKKLSNEWTKELRSPREAFPGRLARRNAPPK